jgi:hypothetical protein
MKEIVGWERGFGDRNAQPQEPLFPILIWVEFGGHHTPLEVIGALKHEIR